MTAHHTILIPAPATEVFTLSQDYARRLEWDPFLRSAELVGGATEAGVGTRAWCVAHNGFGMETEYVSFHPPRACAVKMTRGPWFLASFAGAWRFEEREPGQTEVSFNYHLRGRPGLLSPFLRWVFARDTRRRLEALRRAFIHSSNSDPA